MIEYTVRWKPDCGAGPDGYEYLELSCGLPHLFTDSGDARWWASRVDSTAEVVCRDTPKWEPVEHHSGERGG